MLRDAAWQDWYRAQHDRRCLQTGSSFEDYVSSALSRFHNDFINPTPAGSLGDGGCDGLAEAGSILYACYGSRAQRDTERKLTAKMEGDFTRALATWSTFTRWRFVTNAPAGPEAAAYLVEIQRAHGPETPRPIQPRLWNPDQLWFEVVINLTPRQLDELLPGVPRAENIELSDLVPLLDLLGNQSDSPEQDQPIRPVPVTKMDFNELPAPARAEFNEGRLLAPRIDDWFKGQSDPDLRDRQGRNFKGIYEEQKRTTTNPGELVERLYTALGGSDFRHDSKRANAVYAVTAYFFDSCDIFEEPAADYEGGQHCAVAN